MTLPAFDYAVPDTVVTAADLLAADADAVPLAGGHNLLYAMKTGRAAPSRLVDLRRLAELRGVRETTDGRLEIGAMTTLAELADHPALAGGRQAWSDALAVLGDPQVRHRGTVGGNLVSGARPEPGRLCPDLPAVVLASGATLTLVGAGHSRTVSAGEFFAVGFPAPLHDEVLVRVSVPARPAGSAGAYQKFRDRASLAPVVGVAVELELSADGTIASCRAGLTGSVPAPSRLSIVETAVIEARPVEEQLRRTLPAVPVDMFSGRRTASREFLAHMCGVLVGRALARAAGYARPAGPAATH
jgi:carbon-monoxide dehydrogenase medium subunit